MAAKRKYKRIDPGMAFAAADMLETGFRQGAIAEKLGLTLPTVSRINNALLGNINKNNRRLAEILKDRPATNVVPISKPKTTPQSINTHREGSLFDRLDDFEKRLTTASALVEEHEKMVINIHDLLLDIETKLKALQSRI